MYYQEELVEEIRARNDIVDVIGSYVRLSKKGSSYMGLCPFHNEKSPSFSVSAAKQMYHCFGCGVGGNVFTFIMEYENYSFIEALKLLAERAGITLPEIEYSEEAKRAANLKGRLFEINKIAAKYFFYQLKSERGKGALDYLKERSLTEETIVHFGLGYSNKTSDDLYRYLKNSGYEDELLRQSGLISMEEAKGAFDKFWNRVMFPIMDVNNKVIGFGGRVMGEGAPKYLNSPETKIFDKSRNLYGLNFARQSRMSYLLICEGYMDVISLHQAGFTNAVASLGTAFTALQAKLLSRYTKEVLLTYDSDGAGMKAALRAIPIIKEAGLSVKVINMQPYKDPDEFIKACGVEEYQKRIDQAQNSFFFEVEATQKHFHMEDPEQKTRFFNELAKMLLQFREELERNNYIEAAAKKYGISYDNLRQLVNRYGAQMSNIYIAQETRVREKDSLRSKNKPEEGIKQSQKLLLTWLIEDNKLFEQIEGIIDESDFTEELYQKTAAMLLEQYQKEHVVNPAKIINYFESKEEQTAVADLFNTQISGEMNENERKKAFEETIVKIKTNSLDIKYLEAVKQGDIFLAQNLLKQQNILKTTKNLKELQKI